MNSASEPAANDGASIAVVGMAGRFPGAGDLGRLWANLVAGVESIRTFSEAEVLAAGADPREVGDARYVRAGGVLDGADLFDAGLFGIPAADAEILDPQQRVFLEIAFEALEAAGIAPATFPGLVGVFAGTTASSYLLRHLLPNPALLARMGMTAVALANDKDYLAARVAYKLDLRGPTFTVQTACSTSLVAVHLACQSLLNRECDAALAGGVSILFPQEAGYLYEKEGILSPDGHCRAFDAAAAGTVGGRGAAAVVLRRLADALADGDLIHAVIRGSAINNDGAGKVGFTAPSVAGQSEVIAEALGLTGIDPETVGFVEAHGTGTALGDPIEVEALTRAWRQRTPARTFCALGGIKTNLGHLDAAAGVTGLIKAVLAVREGEIPPSLHFTEPNPKIALAESPFFVNTATVPFPRRGAPRRAAVSSFGLGGTNAHVLLEEAPAREPSGPSRYWQLLSISARTPEALEAATARLGDYLTGAEGGPEALADAAYTLALGRRAFPHRRIALARRSADAARALADPRLLPTREAEDGDRPVAYLFSGLGEHALDLGAGLYASEPLFRQTLDRAAEILHPHLGLDLAALLYAGREERFADRAPSFGDGPDLKGLRAPRPEPRDTEAARRLGRTAIAQPALFAVQYAVARLWASWGVKPQAMLGYSLGEYVAAALAGVFSFEDALAVVALRARLIDELPEGGMVAAALSREEAEAHLSDALFVAAVNAPQVTVLAGTASAVDELTGNLTAAGVAFRRLDTRHPFHTPLLSPAAEALRAALAKVELKAPRRPYLSNVTGTWVTPDEATSPEAWSRHLTSPVRFADAAAEIWRAPRRVLLEMGPGRSLLGLALLNRPEGTVDPVALPSLPAPGEEVSDQAFLLSSLGQLWTAGGQVDWRAFFGKEKRRKVALPTYPFERRRYWIERAGSTVPAVPAGEPTTGKQPDVTGWFFVPTFEPADEAIRPLPEAAPGETWVVLGEGGLARQVVETLEAAGRRVVKDLESAGSAPAGVVDLRSHGPISEGEPATAGYERLLHLVHTWTARFDEAPGRIAAVTSGLFDLSGAEPLAPERAPLLGLLKVIPQEHENLACWSFDLPEASPAPLARQWAERLLGEVATDSPERTVALRGARRSALRYVPRRLEAAPRPLPPGGAYLILGGSGKIGRRIADLLTESGPVHLALVGRSAAAEDDPHVARLEEQGATVLPLVADLANEDSLCAAVAAAYQTFSRLDGVFHCAGVTQGPSLAPIAQLDAERSAVQFEAKVTGLYNLERALERVVAPLSRLGRGDGGEGPPPFCFLVSSASAVLGGLGLAAYTAASTFMDAFAASRNQIGGTLWMTADWDPWPGESAPEEGGEVHTSVDQYTMTGAEAADAVRRLLAARLPHAAVITGDFEARRRIWLSAGGEADGKPLAELDRHGLAVPYEAPTNDTESVIAGVWERHLGVAPIGIRDNFFRLGGHSLLGMRLRSELEQVFGVDIPLAAVLETPTVAEMALAVELAILESLTAETSPP